MESHKFISLLIAFVAIAYGIGRLMGAASVPPEPEETTVVSAVEVGLAQDSGVATTASATNRQPSPPQQTGPPPNQRPNNAGPKNNLSSPPRAGQGVGGNSGGARRIAAASPSAVPRPRPVGELPIEPGMPADDGKPLADAKPAPLPQAPKGWMTSPARGATEPLVLVIVASDFQ